MADCCDPRPYKGVFDEREAARTLKRFQKRGLDSAAAPMVQAVAERGLEGATVLEVGVGSATALTTMLERGAARGIGYDLSPEYEAAATQLLASKGLSDRAELRYGDFVADAATAGSADVVFLNKVVCCYPDRPRLVDAATGATTRLLAMSFPRRRWLTRAGLKVINVLLRLRGTTFRVHLHDPKAIAAQVASHGLVEEATGTTPMWEWHVWERKVAG